MQALLLTHNYWCWVADNVEVVLLLLSLLLLAVTFNEGFLGQENEEYQKWITNKDHWSVHAP